MAESRGNALHATIVESHHATVRERQLQFALALLTCHLARHRTVHLVRQPVFAGHSLKAENPLKASDKLRVLGFFGVIGVFDVSIPAFHGLVPHDSLGRMTKHLSHIQVERTHAIRLLEGEVGIACGLSDDVKRRTLPFGYLADVFDVLLVDEESHAFLAFVGDDFLGRECRVADGKLRHVNESAALFHKLGEAVDVSRATMIMDADHGIHFLFAKRTHQVIGTLLHFGVGSLHGIEFYTTAVATCIHTGNAAAAKADAIVITAHDHYLIAFLGFFLEAIALRAIAHAACQHDDFVVGILLVALLMLECEH